MNKVDQFEEISEISAFRIKIRRLYSEYEGLKSKLAINGQEKKTDKRILSPLRKNKKNE